VDWTRQDVLAATRAELTADHRLSNWTFERADLDGDQLLVVFRVNDSAPVRRALGTESRFAVHYTIADLPAGPNTGWECASSAEWAAQVVWDLDEQVDGGYITLAQRTRTADGLTLLTWYGRQPPDERSWASRR
jgi:hypothetical protein